MPFYLSSKDDNLPIHSDKPNTNELINEISMNLPNEKLIKQIAKSYNPLAYTVQLINQLQNIYPAQNFAIYEKLQLHRIMNDTLMSFHLGEKYLKYELFNHYLKKDIIGAFEIKVNNSRADFITINGYTSSFEIKSYLDNLRKLSKQSLDYIKVFEYNHLVVDDRHVISAMKIVPKSFGIWSLNSGNKKVYRDASLNEEMLPETQLSLLTRKEINIYFEEVGGQIKDILSLYKASIINERFKNALKDRYRRRWNFILANQKDILPIDLQFFFNTNINPQVIYAN